MKRIDEYEDRIWKLLHCPKHSRGDFSLLGCIFKLICLPGVGLNLNEYLYGTYCSLAMHRLLFILV